MAALRVADMRMILRLGRKGRSRLRMMRRKSELMSRSWISSTKICDTPLSRQSLAMVLSVHSNGFIIFLSRSWISSTKMRDTPLSRQSLVMVLSVLVLSVLVFSVLVFSVLVSELVRVFCHSWS